MKLTKKMTFGMLATVAVVALPIAVVTSCGDDSKDETITKDGDGNTTSTGINITITATTKKDEVMKALQPIMGSNEPMTTDITFKIGSETIKIKKGTSLVDANTMLQNEVLPKIKAINPMLAQEIMSQQP